MALQTTQITQLAQDYKAGKLPRDQFVHQLINYPYKSPERSTTPRDGTFAQTDSLDYNEMGTFDEVKNARAAGLIPDDVYNDIYRGRYAKRAMDRKAAQLAERLRSAG